jgi:asparagine synthase (glutamine-hydrolysing)
MAEILAIFNLDQKPVYTETIHTMVKVISEQANQGMEFFVAENIGLTCQYFWLTSQETDEKQPIWASTGNIAIIGSVRLDNRSELIENFNIDQETQKNISDTALVLLAFQKWGTSCPEHFLGEYAFIIWDASTKSLFLARDVLGVKNLVFMYNGNSFIAASDMEMLLAYPGKKFHVNEGKIADWLTNNYFDQSESCYTEIRYLPPAHAMSISSEGLKKWQYWQIDPEKSIYYKNDVEYADHLEQILMSSVKDRLRTVGLVGVSMSGGLDSPSIAAIASQMLPTNHLNQKFLPSYSYAFNHVHSCDERVYIEHMLEAYPLSPRYVFCDHQWTLKDLATWPVYREYPTSDPYPRLPLSIMKVAQQDGIKLLLSGYYGDTLFNGYSYWLADMIRHAKLSLIQDSLQNCQPWKSKAKTILHSGFFPLVPHTWKNLIRKLVGYQKNIPNVGLHSGFIHKTELKNRLNQDSGWKEYQKPGQWDRLRRLTLNIYPQGLAVVNKEYRKHGMEISSPYWDRRLVEFVMAIPAYQLGRPGLDRYVMRNAMKGILPEPIRLRTQRTVFTELFTMGIFDKEREMVKQLLENPLIVQQNIIRPEWLRAEFEAGTNWSADGYYFWKALSLELWLRKVYNEPLPEK